MRRLLPGIAAALLLAPSPRSGADAPAAGGSWTAGADGARLVVCGAALVTASKGSRVSFSCAGGAAVTLEDGAARIVAGSRGVRVAAGGTELPLSSARIEIARVGGRWLARGAPDAELPLPAPLRAGELVDLGAPAGADPGGEDAAAFSAAASRAAPIPAPGRALRARRVEAPVAAGPQASAGGGETAEVELEPIEVEVGCIEVCVD